MAFIVPCRVTVEIFSTAVDVLGALLNNCSYEETKLLVLERWVTNIRAHVNIGLHWFRLKLTEIFDFCLYDIDFLCLTKICQNTKLFVYTADEP